MSTNEDLAAMMVAPYLSRVRAQQKPAKPDPEKIAQMVESMQKAQDKRDRKRARRLKLKEEGKIK